LLSALLGAAQPLRSQEFLLPTTNRALFEPGGEERSAGSDVPTLTDQAMAGLAALIATSAIFSLMFMVASHCLVSTSL